MGLVRTLYDVARFLFIARLSGGHLRSLVKDVNSPEELVNVVFNYRYRDPIVGTILSRDVYITIRPAQIYEEILELAKLIAELKPKTVLEIGTADGGTLFLWCRLASDDARIISVDLPGGPFGGGYPIWRGVLYKYFKKPKQELHLVRGDSHDLRTFKKVKEVLGSEGVDFLFIDGDHSYEGVKKDFEMYSPLVKNGGIIAFHDIVPGPPENVGGVPRFWQEVKRGYRYLEFVKDWKQGGYGIGVIFI